MREYLIAVASYGFMSKELEDYVKQAEITVYTLANDDDYLEARQILRILQKLENQTVHPTAEVEAQLNSLIDTVNSDLGISTFINGIIGLHLLMRYKEEWVGKKKYGIGISFDNMNSVYDNIERHFLQEGSTQVVIDSQKVADKLYEEIMQCK